MVYYYLVSSTSIPFINHATFVLQCLRIVIWFMCFIHKNHIHLRFSYIITIIHRINCKTRDYSKLVIYLFESSVWVARGQEFHCAKRVAYTRSRIRTSPKSNISRNVEKLWKWGIRQTVNKTVDTHHRQTRNNIFKWRHWSTRRVSKIDSNS